MQRTIMRPGLLVSLKTSIKGNVKYFTNTLEADHTTEDGERRARWDTTRTVKDPDEHERAVKARSAARGKIQAVCIGTEHGLLCPQAMASELDTALEEARVIAQDFNRTATQTRLRVNVVVGEISQDDARAIRSINSEIADLMETMREGLENLDPSKVKETIEKARDAANKARAVSGMLAPETQERVQAAIETFRKAARKIVAAGEGASIEIDRVSINRIMEARTAFLDIEDDAAEVQAVEPTARPVDFESETFSEPTKVQSAPIQTRMFDLD